MDLFGDKRTRGNGRKQGDEGRGGECEKERRGEHWQKQQQT